MSDPMQHGLQTYYTQAFPATQELIRDQVSTQCRITWARLAVLSAERANTGDA